MPKVTLETVLNDVRSLTREERERLRMTLDRLLAEPGTLSPEDEVERRMFEAGLLSEIKPPLKDRPPYQRHPLIEVKGKPLSETIIEERR